MFFIAGVSTILVFWKKYDDGIVGRAALAVAAIGCGLGILDAMYNTHTIHYSPITAMVLTGVAVFVLRHLYRFTRFYCGGEFSWSKLRDHAG